MRGKYKFAVQAFVPSGNLIFFCTAIKHVYLYIKVCGCRQEMFQTPHNANPETVRAHF